MGEGGQGQGFNRVMVGLVCLMVVIQGLSRAHSTGDQGIILLTRFCCTFLNHL